MTLLQLFDILRARWKLTATVLAVALALAVVVSLLMPKRYTASAQVLVDMKSPDPVLGVLLPGQMVPGYMATQMDIVGSQRVALKVVDTLRLAENAQAIAQWRAATDGIGSIRHHYSDLLLKGLDVKPSRESSVLTIGYTGADPEFAAVVANAFATAYVELSVELKVEPARQSRGFFDGQTQALRDKLEAAQGRLSAYQRAKGIVSADERLDIEGARLAELSSQLVALQAQAVEANRRQAMARDAAGKGVSGDLPEVLASPLVQSLKAEFARVEARLDQQAAVLGQNHPEILKLREERASIKSKIDREITSITASLGRTSQLQTEREAEVKAALDRQRARVLQIKEVRDEMTVLQREVESAQRAFDLAGQRLTQTSLESQTTQANVVVLTPAAPPARPSSPRIGLNVALAAFLGSLLGLAAALGAELRDRRVRGPQDLRLASGLEPIGALRDAFAGRYGRERKKLARRLRRASGAALEHTRPMPLPGSAEHPGAFAPTVFGALPEREEREPETVGAPPDRPSVSGSGAAQAAAARSAGSAESPHRQPIGQILVQAGLIHPPEVERILAWARQEGVRFGEAAVANKLLTPDQVERALAYQFDYPVLAPGSSPVSEEVVAAYDGRNPLVADLRRLRAKIRSAQVGATPEAPLKSLAVVSSGTGEGKSFLAANLAVTFSQMGQRTLLIDADLRRGRLHRMFGLPNSTGLSSMLNRRIGAGSLQRIEGLRNLTLLTCGPEAPNPSELLSRDVFGQLLEAFSRSFDIVILDTPGVAEEPDATLVAQRAGAALVLARQNRSSFDAVVELVQSGGTQRVAVLGSVLNLA